MTRIIAGAAKGRRLQTPRGELTRPTSDRVREALFSAVESWCGSLQGLRVLDLYAGSGAVGLEAWSRGATHVELVERDRPTAALVSANVRDLGCRDAHVVTADVARHLAHPPAHLLADPSTRFDVVFSDPPYARTDDEVARDLELLQAWVAPDALVVVERSRRSPEPRWPTGIAGERSKRYGETVLHYAHAVPDQPGEQPDQQPDQQEDHR